MHPLSPEVESCVDGIDEFRLAWASAFARHKSSIRVLNEAFLSNVGKDEAMSFEFPSSGFSSIWEDSVRGNDRAFKIWVSSI